MLLAQKSDKKDAISIIAKTFDKNPSVNIVIGESGNRQKKLKRLASYVFTKSLNREGAFLSNNRKGTALCFVSSRKGKILPELIEEIRFVLVLPFSNIISSLKREKYIQEHRMKEKHLYFWFLGVEKGGNKAVFEIKDQIFQWSEKKKLPILLETSVIRNKKVYERYGFEVYHTWDDSGNGNALWFMRRMP